MLIEKSIDGLFVVFRVNAEKRLELLHFSNHPMTRSPEEIQNKWYQAADIHITGRNQNDHHGGKYSGCSSLDTLQYVSHNAQKTGNGELLSFVLRDDQIEATLHYQFYHGISGVRCWTCVKNISGEQVGLEYVGAFSLMGIEEDTPEKELQVFIPHTSWQRDVNWKAYHLHELGFNRTPTLPFSLKRIACSNTGTWSTKEYLPMGGFARKESVLLWQIENNGSWYWEISDLANEIYLKISGPNERENGWYKELAPGETFEGVKSSVMIGNDFNDAMAQMSAYRRNIIRKTPADQNFPVIFNDYMNCLNADPTEEKEYPLIDCAAQAGAEYYVIDGGWYADGEWWDSVGEWQPCGWRWPNGIKRVFDYIRAKNMVPGLWLEIEAMGIHCPISDQLTDDCFFMRHGKRVIDHGRYQLDFRNPRVREFANSVIDRVVNEYGVGYIKMDYNIDGGIGTEVNADSFGDGLLQSNRAYLAWITEIQDRYPDLILECCASGGMRMDYASVSQCALYSVSDQTECVETTHVAQQAPTAVLPEQAAIWSYPLATDDLDMVAMNMIGPLLLRMYVSGQLADLDEKQFALVQEAVSCYKSIRQDIAGSVPFYPFGIPCYEDKLFCVGMRSKDKTYLKVWRLDTDEDTLCISMNSQDARVIYPAVNNAVLKINDQTLNITLQNPNSAVLIVME